MKTETKSGNQAHRNQLEVGGFWRSQVLKVLAEVRAGRLEVYENDALLLSVGESAENDVALDTGLGRVNIRSEDAYRAIALGGAIGLQGALKIAAANLDHAKP